MIRSKILLAALALVFPLAGVIGSAQAASTHALEFGASNENSTSMGKMSSTKEIDRDQKKHHHMGHKKHLKSISEPVWRGAHHGLVD